jgi:hypothetical protein
MRLDGWEKEFNAFIESRVNAPFVWGVHDCCLFANDSVFTLTGLDCAVFFRGRYDDAESAYKRMKEYSGGSVPECMEKFAEVYGFEEIGINYAGRGDVALCHVETHIGGILPTLGVVDGSGKILIAGRKGLNSFKKSTGERFWKIG